MYHIYILLCKDGTFYTGYTTDIEKRLHNHNATKQGAKYTRGRRPVTLVYQESFSTEQEAKKREYEIKQLTKKEKELLIRKI